MNRYTSQQLKFYDSDSDINPIDAAIHDVFATDCGRVSRHRERIEGFIAAELSAEGINVSPSGVADRIDALIDEGEIELKSRKLIRATEDLGPFVDVDGNEYNLEAGGRVAPSEAVADALIENGVAEEEAIE